MENYGFIRAAASCPKLKVADVKYNVNEMKKAIYRAYENETDILVFPELSISGYTCGDLFGQDALLDESLNGLKDILEYSKDMNMIIFIGAPLSINHFLFNCAVGIFKGNILGVVPKTYIPNYGEYYEKRWFSSIDDTNITDIYILGNYVPFGSVVFQNRRMPQMCIGAEVCEDLWAPIPPSSYAALNGASIIVNLSASNELINKASYRRELVKQQSGRLLCSYIYSSSGVHESTTDMVFSGHLLIGENGSILKENERFERDSEIIIQDIDVQRLFAERRKNLTFKDSNKLSKPYRKVDFDMEIKEKRNLLRYVDAHPFVPSNAADRDERCKEIFNIQTAGLAKRIEHTNLKKLVIGVSGGLDSTLALLVAVKTFKLLNYPLKDIITITMPGFGTTDRTYNNTIELCRCIGTDLREINIKDACLLHFRDIGHDAEILDVTYENVQARERTQILMDIANKEGGLVVGTGDLSEVALGWSTYNGDHMSMYAVNCSVPKTLVRYLVGYVAEREMEDKAGKILIDILNTPVSPELLPGNEGKITQKTEDIIGPYELHDFFLYHFIKYGASPQKILYIAGIAFKDKYSKEEIEKWLKLFYRRFFTQQFKRSCIPDGPKVGTISLSPRGDWRMPSDASFDAWLGEF
ncbi:NAD+ synthase (glutamine-hydrolysing) [Caloramator quimbayensis]|uniref:Glutamine-dependent NAD(+) synthetase n=1 Tax=Caloramator quimbayensis TaxID=1147123 RepID=A0A1T4WEF9_9CLOT|nr:NAD(+) synthase [Caloramator quimbayensis]SKA75577.1 NAD+ synthase (glutamine-hydrolysing) [Caloramator quimbayensis]